MKQYELVKREILKDESPSPFYQKCRDTVRNISKNPVIFYDTEARRVIVKPGETLTFEHYISRPLGNRKVRSKRPGTDYWEVRE